MSQQGSPSDDIAQPSGDVYVTPSDLASEGASSVSFPNLSHNAYLYTTNTRKRNKKPTQSTLFQYLPNAFQQRYPPPPPDPNESHWGNTHKTKPDNSIRIWYTNPCGLGINPTGSKSHTAFSFLHKKSKADVVCLSETNLRWASLHHKSRLNNRVRDFYQQFHTAASYNTHENLGKSQRGGTCTIALEQPSYRATSSGTDTTGLGRWSWIQFSGRGGLQTRIVTGYRPCKPSSSSKLTTVYDQHMRYVQDRGINLNPRELFDRDLSNELENWIERQIRIVLCLDANEDVNQGPFHDLMTRLGLLNAHTLCHLNALPATHDRGSKPISGIFVSPTIRPTRAGILEHGCGIEGDHRNMFIDVDETNFLGDDLYDIPPPAKRRLQLFDSRVVKRFNTHCLNHLQQNNILQQTNNLLNMPTDTPSTTIAPLLEAIDDQFGRAISFGEKKCRKLKSGEIPFSEEFRTLNNTRRFWLLLLKRRYGKKVSTTTIRRLTKQLNLSQIYSIDIREAKLQLSKSRKAYVEFVKKTKTEREKFLESLAEANAQNGRLKKTKVLKRLLHEEDQRVGNKTMKSICTTTKIQRLDRVEVNEGGTWTEISEPAAVTEALRQMNDDKYAATSDTPLMNGQLLQDFGYLGEKTATDEVLSGTYEYPPCTTEATRDMLNSLQKPEYIKDLPLLISPQEYKEAWNRVKEKSLRRTLEGTSEYIRQ